MRMSRFDGTHRAPHARDRPARDVFPLGARFARCPCSCRRGGSHCAADVAAASGVAGIAAADDISVDVDVTCLFSVPAATDAISIGSQSVGDYLGGELVGATPAALATVLADVLDLALASP